MDTSRVGRGEMIAAVSAVLLFLFMFIFDWFGIDASGIGLDASRGWNAWQAFDFINIILLITVLVAVGAALLTANAQSVNAPVAISAITAGLGILSVLLILFRIISPPDLDIGGFGLDTGFDVGRKIGVYLGLLASIGIAYGGWQAMQEEGTSFSDQRDRFGDGGGTPPPPPPADTGSGSPPPPPPPAQ